MKWERTHTGTYKLGDYRIIKTPSNRLCKGEGWDVSIKQVEKIGHFATLKEAKNHVEGLYKEH